MTTLPPPAMWRRWFLPPAAPLLLGLLASCQDSPGVRAAESQVTQGVIDSTLPIEEEVRRFVATVDSLPRALRHGATSRDDLVGQFLAAVEGLDTLKLHRLVVQRDEFISLYYPHTRFTAPPYELSPALVWFQMQNSSSRGIGRLLERSGGKSLAAQGYRCAAEAAREASNRLWEDCLVAVRDSAGGIRERRLFGTILERDGRFKFLTFANEY